MIAPKNSASGFTLIELLTVIAIIGILAALTAATLPKALERARMTTLVNSFTQMRTILVDYSTDHASYPPGYGYVDKNAFLSRLSVDQLRSIYPIYRINRPYMSYFDPTQFRNFDLYDTFATQGSDTDLDTLIAPLEFMPMGRRDLARGPDAYFFDFDIYPANPTLDDRDRQQDAVDRPLVYIPVYKRHFERYRDFLYKRAAFLGTDPRPREDDPQSPLSLTISYPPPTYDAAVLISVGPNKSTSGLLRFINPNTRKPFNTEWGLTPADEANLAPEYRYHALGMMTYFMATRDFDDNGRLDFDFTERTRNGEGKNPNNYLPGLNPQDDGPAIFVIDL